MPRLAPHLFGAMRLAVHLEALAYRHDAAEQYLDSTQSALMLVSTDGSLRDANPAAAALLSRRDTPIREQGRRVVFSDETVQRRFASLLADPDRPIGAPTVCAPGTGGGIPLEATEVTFQRRTLGLNSGGPLRLVILRPSGYAAPVDRDYLRARLDLTRAEAGVLALLRTTSRSGELADGFKPSLLSWSLISHEGGGPRR